MEFGPFVLERDRCRDPAYRSPDPVLRDGYFTNTNRMWDHVSQQLVKVASGDAPWARRLTTRPPWVGQAVKMEKVATVVALRMAGSPREEERPGRSGATPIMAAVRGRPRELFSYIRMMPFSGRHTYRAVVNKSVLAAGTLYVSHRLALRRSARTLQSLQERVNTTFKSFHKRNVRFHSLQIACDLMSLGLVRVEDMSDCPLTVGSKRGLKWVRQYDRSATVKSLAESTGREAHEIQTSLCEYDKYRRWTADPGSMRRRG